MRYHEFSFMSDIMEGVALIILLAIAIYLVYIIFTHHFKDKTIMFSNHRALIILSERYAKGEITDDEYEKKRKLLSGKCTSNDKKSRKNEILKTPQEEQKECTAMNIEEVKLNHNN